MTVSHEPLVLNPTQVKRHEGTDAYRRLRNSIAEFGILQPIGVRPGEGGTWIVSYGNGRGMVAKELRLTDVPVMVLDREMTETEYHLLLWVENEHRQNYSLLDQIDYLEQLAALQPDWNNKRLADALQFEASTVSRYRAVHRLCVELPEVRDLIRGGLLNLSAAYEVFKGRTLEERKHLLTQAVGGADRGTLGTARRSAGNGTTTERIPRIRIPLAIEAKEVSAHGVVTVAGVAGGEVGLDETETLLLEAIKAVREAKKRGLGIKAAQASWKDMAKAGV